MSLEKLRIIHEIAKQSHLPLLKVLPPWYAPCLEKLEKYLSESPLQEINFPRCEAFPEGFKYMYRNKPIVSSIFSDVEGIFTDSLLIRLELVITDTPKIFYDYNHSIDYYRKSTMESWNEGRFGKVSGEIKLVVPEKDSVEITNAVMTILMLAYMDFKSMQSHEGYTYVPPLKGRFSLAKNTDEFLKCSTDPCINLIGTIVNQTEYFPKPETLWPSRLTAVGMSADEIIETMTSRIKEDLAYSRMQIISDNLDRVEEMLKVVDESYLCDMWKRGMKIKAHSRAEVISFLRSSFDHVKNEIFAEIIDRMVHATIRKLP